MIGSVTLPLSGDPLPISARVWVGRRELSVEFHVDGWRVYHPVKRGGRVPSKYTYRIDGQDFVCGCGFDLDSRYPSAWGGRIRLLRTQAASYRARAGYVRRGRWCRRR